MTMVCPSAQSLYAELPDNRNTYLNVPDKTNLKRVQNVDMIVLRSKWKCQCPL